MDRHGRRLGARISMDGKGRWIDNFDFYNRRRIHQSHEYQTPDEIYYATTVREPLAIAA
jgi:hypothetical protein